MWIFASSKGVAASAAATSACVCIVAAAVVAVPSALLVVAAAAALRPSDMITKAIGAARLRYPDDIPVLLVPSSNDSFTLDSASTNDGAAPLPVRGSSPSPFWISAAVLAALSANVCAT